MDEDHATTTLPSPLQLSISHHLPLHKSGRQFTNFSNGSHTLNFFPLHYH